MTASAGVRRRPLSRLSALVVGLAVVCAGCSREPDAAQRSRAAATDTAVTDTALLFPLDTTQPSRGDVPMAVYACARCHTLPPPDLLPRARWPRLIERMKLITEQYALGPALTQEELDAASRYYNAHSPDALPGAAPAYRPTPLAFSPRPFGAPPPAQASGAPPPVIGHLNADDLDRDGRPDVLVSDISLGALTWIHQTEPGRWVEEVLAEVVAPARTEVVDANGDGHLDVVIAALGGIEPTDDPIGQVVLLLNDGHERFTPQTLLRDVPRVPDVRPADLDGDGDLDFLVATFGLYRTGQAGWLERRDGGGYTYHTIYERNGISHVPVTDLNGDGLPDFVALISQEHEEVMAFVNRGAGRFEPHLLYKAPHPMFGSSHLHLADLDRDGDPDVVFTNGDALDIDPYPKPWHGVQWLENQGDLRFAYHDVARFAGAYSAVSSDLDGDGDADLVVTSMLNDWDDPARQSIIWLENDGRQRFTPHPLSASPTFLVTAAVADFNGDRRPDVVAGGMYVLAPYYRVGRVTLWLNTPPPR